MAPSYRGPPAPARHPRDDVGRLPPSVKNRFSHISKTERDRLDGRENSREELGISLSSSSPHSNKNIRHGKISDQNQNL